ncbi:alpha/beta fold hydrolase [Flagellimonas meishanensis]|uniref:alpha/beta fold hydrolase n=1 Tax=Flagellimonas meishanensis TaxID=2873264 RepID=UPI001CA5FE1D|nr:alpha/beta fold hydrolase [[Muricauda] meishanensis]
MKYWSILLLVFGVALTSKSMAQELQRKASLGIGIVTVNDSVAEVNKLQIASGALVTRIISGSTAANLGMQTGDVVLQINDEEITDRSQVFALARGLREGVFLRIQINRNGKTKTIKGHALGKPKESSSNDTEVIYGTLQTRLGRLRTIVHKPKRVDKSPAIFFLQGIYCGSQDFWANPTEPAKLLIDDFVNAGYTVYRIERPGIGDSEEIKNCRDIDYEEELEIHKAAYVQFRALPYVDMEQLFLFGHSMGSVTAPILAKAYQPKGIIVYAPIYKTWFEYFLDNFREQPIYFGVETREQMDAMVRNSISLMHQWLIEGKSPQEIRKDPKNKKYLDEEMNVLNYSDGDYFFGRHYTFFSTINSIRNAESWSNVKSKVLAIYGTSDLQALNNGAAKDIVSLINEQNPGQGTFLEIPEADHVFAKIKSKEEGARLSLAGEYRAHIMENYHPSIAKDIIAWMSPTD